MSVVTVKNISHGFGDRAIFEDVSFRLLKGEHVGLIGANGEGKSTFMNIITGKLMPDEGKVIWSNNVRVGYMDQHAVLTKGTTIRDALRDAFKYLFDLELEMNELYGKMGEVSEDELNKMLERTAVIQ
ncbi:MAG: ATP-binding cassette domain-containing protein, partial [Clostridium sp.]